MGPSNAELEITDPKRIKQFAAFFKNYMGVSSVIVAALPIPATMLQLIPVYKEDRGSLSVITSLICFLILGYIFYSRHALGRRLFFSREAFDRKKNIWDYWRKIMSPGLLIFVLIAFALVAFFAYLSFYIETVDNARGQAVDLQRSSYVRVKLMVLYTGFFACAEAAFILMATKEYLQDLLQLSDSELIDWRYAEQIAFARATKDPNWTMPTPDS